MSLQHSENALFHGFLFVLMVAASNVTDAQEAERPDRRAEHRTDKVVSSEEPAYPAAFFAPFQPQTAIDMLNRTPGFTVLEGSLVRGFGGAAGNVLIDGQRPAVKVGGISEVLRRIPAARVERIVLLRGGEAAAAQGQTLIANVILKVDSKGSGTTTVGATHTADDRVVASGRSSYARKLGDWQVSLELSAETIRYPSQAVYELRDATGDLIQSREERIRADAPAYGLATSVSHPLAGGTLTINGRLAINDYNSLQTLLLYPGPLSLSSNGRRDIRNAEHNLSIELGGDWTHGVGKGWTVKLVGLRRTEQNVTNEDYTEPGLSGVLEQVTKPIELVARATLGREGDYRLRPEIGGEVSWNALTSGLDNREDNGSGLMPVALSGANTRVTELRSEGFANLNARLNRTFATELGIAVEFSRIQVTGDAHNTQTLYYLKPSAALIWSPSSKTQLRLGVRRTVDQLDFGDFAASVDKANNRAIGGNSELRPARITRALLGIDHRWGKSGAVSAELFYQWHEGMLGYIALDSGDQALGAIGTARQWGLTAHATLPLSGLIRNALLKLDGTVLGSRVVDPLTDRTRPIDGLTHGSLLAEFRHDLPDVHSAWGVRYEAAAMSRTWYLAEEAYGRTHPVWTVYVETTALAGMKAVLTGEALNGRDSSGIRRFYTISRADALSGVERRDLREGLLLSLTLTHSL